MNQNILGLNPFYAYYKRGFCLLRRGSAFDCLTMRKLLILVYCWTVLFREQSLKVRGSC